VRYLYRFLYSEQIYLRQYALPVIAVAVDRGIVTVRVHHKIGECVEMARILRQPYNLGFCEVVPSASSLAVAPIMVLGWLTQKQLVQGLTFGAVK